MYQRQPEEPVQNPLTYGMVICGGDYCLVNQPQFNILLDNSTQGTI